MVLDGNFPRGGAPQNKAVDADLRVKEIDFGAEIRRPKKLKVTKEKKAEHLESSDSHFESVSAELLNLKNIVEGINIYGIVQSICPTYVMVLLPGGLRGRLMATSISKSYRTTLNRVVNDDSLLSGFKTVQELFTINQIVFVKVVRMERITDHYTNLTLSMEPSAINSGIQHSDIKMGMFLQVAVKEIEEHGYVLETGIKDLRAFLPINGLADQKTLAYGETIICKVNYVKLTSVASTAKFQQIDHTVRHHTSDISHNELMPTAIVDFKITAILKDGLEGSILQSGSVGLINEHHLELPLSNPKDYKIGQVYRARVLYIMPISNLVYLTLHLNCDSNHLNVLEKGTVINDATVIRRGARGIIVNLLGKAKGVIFYRSLRENFNSRNIDSDELLAKYSKNSTHSVRILDYEEIDRIHVCTVNTAIINERYLTLNDVRIGDYVHMEKINQISNGDLVGQVGKIKAIVRKIDLQASIEQHHNYKLRCRIIRIDINRSQIQLTNRNEFMTPPSTNSILTTLDSGIVGKVYPGMIAKCYENRWLITFFNDLKGYLYKSSLKNEVAELGRFFYEGQILNLLIENILDNKIGLSINIEKSLNFETGVVMTCYVVGVKMDGLEICIEESNMRIVIPVDALTEYKKLQSLILHTYHPGDKLRFICFKSRFYMVHDNYSVQRWSDIQVGDIIPSFITRISGQYINVYGLINNYKKPIILHNKMIFERQTDQIELNLNQLIFLKILGKCTSDNSLTCSAKLADTWNGDLSASINIFISYLSQVNRIAKEWKNNNNPISVYEIGNVIEECIVTSLCPETNNILLKLPNSTKAVITHANRPKFNVQIGQKLTVVVCWVDYSENCIYVTANKRIVRRCQIDMQFVSVDFIKSAPGLKADVILKTDDVIVVAPRKLTNRFICIPTRLHYNDFDNKIGLNFNEGTISIVTVMEEFGSNLLVGMFEDIFNIFKSCSGHLNSREKKKGRKRKANDELFYEDKCRKNLKKTIKANVNATLSMESTNDNPQFSLKYSQLDGNAKDMTNSKHKENKSDMLNFKKLSKKNTFFLPGVANFWNEPLGPELNVTDSSAEHEKSLIVPNKKRELTDTSFTNAAFKKARIREKHTSKIEKNNANEIIFPTNSDQYDRMVLALPNNSKLWIQYIAFYLQTTEVERARAIARKAIKTISYREPQELRNIWIAMLNLELRYGTDESFESVLSEALQMNDQLYIYMKCLYILASSNENLRLNEMLLTLTKKFKGNKNMWPLVASFWFEQGNIRNAQQLLTRALAVLPAKDHLSIIVTFANLNHKYNEKNSAYALLEQIVTSYPRRVDVWSQYADMLTKDGEICQARQILERAAAQEIPMKKMRTILKKFVDFEKKFGDISTLETVKKEAATYLATELR